MHYEPGGHGDAQLEQYSKLFAACFPKAGHLREPYLRWLYSENPAGPVVAFDAHVDGRVVAHYACIPANVLIDGKPKRALLSLNTATHPDFQGKGLFTRLADSTYQRAAANGFELVYGIANANSTPGFVRKLGFQLVAALESRIGFGRLGAIDWSRTLASAQFRRDWPSQDMAWRLGNPHNPVKAYRLADGSAACAASAGRLGFQAWAELPVLATGVAAARTPLPVLPRVFLGNFPADTFRPRYFSLPGRLRPSPLNFIVKSLREPLQLRGDGLLVSFLDFDAF
jgi:GNAT superfamily N-acetyltransferase